MCGIFGLISREESNISPADYKKILTGLFKFSESRGKEASGFAFVNSDSIPVYKTPYPASRLIASKVFRQQLDGLFETKQKSVAAIGHARLVTNGFEQYNDNNQPVVKKQMVGVHNGIIVNEKKVWAKYTDEERQTELDSEIFPTLFRRFYSKNKSIIKSLHSTFSEIYGMASVAFLFNDLNNLLLATNNGSTYYLNSKDNKTFLFASEFYILQTLITKYKLEHVFDSDDIKQLKPFESLLVNIETAQYERKNYTNGIETDFKNINVRNNKAEIQNISQKQDITLNATNPFNQTQVHIPDEFSRYFDDCEKKIADLKRCSKCLLPETFPYIEFDENGVCNFCNNHKPKTFFGEKALNELAQKHKRNDDRPDVIIPFSGGRDSSFVLHYVVKELGLKPLAYSYDWGMITDLARRNQARLCGKLGVEHIVISADIRKKRANIRKNVLAWLKRPNLGTIPLFMAGDKQYFYFANQLMEINGVNLSFLGENYLENTNFKSGFCGISPDFDKEHIYSLSMMKKLKMAFFYGKEYLLNPAYINSSVWDTLDAFKSYYFIKHRNINLFDYIPWDEKKFETILLNEYDWETDPGTKTTWRIGDGTAAFYNYIYYTVAGFTENDTFRSNQIREGLISREEALKHVIEENKPRYDSLKWYCDTIGIDFEETMKRINTIKGRY